MRLNASSIAVASLLVLAACDKGPVKLSEPERQAVAEEIAQLTTDPTIFDQLFNSQMTASLQSAQSMMHSTCDSMPGTAEQKADCLVQATSAFDKVRPMLEEMTAEIKGQMPEIMKDIGGVMTRTYTDAELVAMRDFYKSPEGQAILKKQPQVMAEAMPSIIERLQPLQMKYLQNMQQQIRGALPQPSPAPHEDR